MGIKTINACEVSCQRCPATIIVHDWRLAADAGWCVPSDGHLHLCPDCLAKQQDEMCDLATKAKVYRACLKLASDEQNKASLGKSADAPVAEYNRGSAAAAGRIAVGIRELAETKDYIGL